MASSNFTENIGLCNWTGEDRPKRTDFVNDNNIIDNLLGNHLSDKNIHVTIDDKERYLHPYMVKTYSGDGRETKTIELSEDFNVAIVCQRHCPLTEFDSSGNAVCHFAIAGKTFGSTHSKGVTFSGNNLLVRQDTTAADGIINNFNEEFGQYVIILLR